MAVENPPTSGFADVADRPTSPQGIKSTSTAWTQMAPLPQSYEAYQAAFEAVEQEGWIDAGDDLVEDDGAERAEPLELPNREHLQTIVDHAATGAIDQLKARKA